MELQSLISKVLNFRKERDWEQFHSPRNLALSIVLESAELLEIFQWKTDAESDKLLSDPIQVENIRDELSDIFLYILLMANDLNIDVLESANKKIDKNALKYPVKKVKGKALKYTEL